MEISYFWDWIIPSRNIYWMATIKVSVGGIKWLHGVYNLESIQVFWHTGIVPWGWIIKIMICSYFLIPWWLCPRGSLDLYPSKLTFPGSQHSLDSADGQKSTSKKKPTTRPSWPYPKSVLLNSLWFRCNA